MFLETLARRNPGLIRSAVALHQAGEIPPNSYVLDLDAIRRNARLIKAAAEAAGLRVYPMAKQVGRNPHFLRAVTRAGMPKFVCVDWMGAYLLARHKAQIGHVGHLVQIPRGEASRICALGPEVWTVFNLEKAREVSEAAQSLGRTQDLLLRVVAPGDTFYPTHDGGFDLEQAVSAGREIARLPGVRVAGVTSFPTLLFYPEKGTVALTPNMQTILRAAERLRHQAGLEITQINAPGTTSAATMNLLGEAGATHVEPGHGFTGTTPWHAYTDLPEAPAICYLTEVTDLHGNQAYVLGGGLYVDPVIPPYQLRALVGSDGEKALAARADAELMPLGGIDYYALLDRRSAKVEIGDSVVFGFRAQAFVTRAYVAVIRGVARGRPRVAGIYDATGRKVSEVTRQRAGDAPLL
jgi:predicted amino acid racemase